MNKCPFCGGQLDKKTITYPQVYEGKIYILENVPAEVCTQCGEVLISPEVLEKIQELVWSREKPGRKAEVPVYDLAEVR
ncbi:MAG: type II toxin-antitoxin system MqsA family antitoxin [Dehalococcoidia bacterium]|nr:type II toxin-antitoxin system MqsA family antitoxin [Dehalococcoidia bacterium]